MEADFLKLNLTIASADEVSVDELVEATQQLREELLELDVEHVELSPGGKVPSGAKVTDPLVIGQLAVQVLSSAAVLGTLGKVIQSWIAARSGYTIKLKNGKDEIEISGPLTRKQRKIVEDWVDRNANRNDG